MQACERGEISGKTCSTKILACTEKIAFNKTYMNISLSWSSPDQPEKSDVQASNLTNRFIVGRRISRALQVVLRHFLVRRRWSSQPSGKSQRQKARGLPRARKPRSDVRLEGQHAEVFAVLSRVNAHISLCKELSSAEMFCWPSIARAAAGKYLLYWLYWLYNQEDCYASGSLSLPYWSRWWRSDQWLLE